MWQKEKKSGIEGYFFIHWALCHQCVRVQMILRGWNLRNQSSIESIVYLQYICCLPCDQLESFHFCTPMHCTQYKKKLTDCTCARMNPSIVSEETSTWSQTFPAMKSKNKAQEKENVTIFHILDEAGFQSRDLPSGYCRGWLFIGAPSVTTKVTVQRDPQAWQWTVYSSREG